MQETDFIQQNKQKWQEFEDVLKNADKDPERITELFVETTDDLSYSRTYYSNRSVRVYLNNISQKIYQTIYTNKTREKNIFKKFWLMDLPVAMWHNRHALIWSFVLFVAGLSVGIISSMYYPDFATIILGSDYIATTESNIASGDPMAIYKDSEPFIMFLQIAWNNIKIAFGTFVLGIVFGIGTVYVVFYNAIMVGTFIYFFIERGLFRESFFAIMLHGTLELSMIVIAGCAGLALAKGLIFPGTYTRGQALFHSARSGIKILTGVTILLLYAAFIESFATRHTEMPDLIRGSIILLSAGIVLGYFVIYPRYLHKNGRIPERESEEVGNKVIPKIQTNIIKSGGKIFTETFQLFSAYSRKITLISLMNALVITMTFALLTSGKISEIQTLEYDSDFTAVFNFIYVWSSFSSHVNFSAYPLSYFVYVALFTIYTYIVFALSNNKLGISKPNGILQFINLLVISSLAATPLLLPSRLTFLILLLLFPIFTLWQYVAYTENSYFITSLKSTFQLIKGNYQKLMGSFLSAFSILWIMLLIISTPLSDFIIKFIQLNIPRNAFLAEESYMYLYTFLLFFIFSIGLSILIFGSSITYHSLKEVRDAGSLTQAIEKVGFKKRAYGLEREV